MNEGLDECNETNNVYRGYQKGNEAKFLHYDLSEDTYFEIEPNYVSWSGLFGDSPQDTLQFKFYDASENKTFIVNEKIPFTPDMIEGNAIEPFEFTYAQDLYTNGEVDCNFNYLQYEHSGSVTSTIPGIDLGDKIFSFVGDNCRGESSAMETPFVPYAFLTLNYGNTALSLVSSFEQTLTRYNPTFSNLEENRNNQYFNVYRDGELIEETINDYFYIDESITMDGEYCYEIVLTDENGQELINSMDQCINIESEPEFNIGDVNQNGVINVTDVIILINMILNQQDYNPLADTNQNGIINVTDVIILINIILNS